MKKSLTLFLLLVTVTCFSQNSWKRTLIGDSTDMMFDIITVDDGFVTTGSTNSGLSGGTDVMVIKIAQSGQVTWSNTYGDSLDQSGLDIIETTDNGYLVLGETTSKDTTGNDIFLLKLSADGELLWSKAYQGEQGEYAAELLQLSDGYMITGYTWSFTQAPDYLLCQVDFSGNIQWSNYYEAGNNETCFGASLTSDDHILLTGSRAVIGTDNALVVKTDIAGQVIWAKEYGGNGVDQSNAVLEAANGDYLFAGSTQSFGSGSLDAYLVRIDSDGNEVWTRSYGTGSWESAYDLISGEDGIILGGEGYAGDYYLLFLDDDGLIERERIFDNEGWERSFSVTANDDWSDILLAGFSASHNDHDDREIFLVKTNGEGIDCEEEQEANTVISTQSSTVSSVDITTDTAHLVVETLDFDTKAISLVNHEICSQSVATAQWYPTANEKPMFYPNPAYHTLYLKSTNPVPSSVSLYNATGALVLKTTLRETKSEYYSIDISSLMSGTYYVVTDYPSGQSLQIIMVK